MKREYKRERERQIQGERERETKKQVRHKKIDYKTCYTSKHKIYGLYHLKL